MIGQAMIGDGDEAIDGQCAACYTEASKTALGILKRYRTIGSHPDIWLCGICAGTTIGHIPTRYLVNKGQTEGEEVMRAVAQVGNMILKEMAAIRKLLEAPR